MNHGMLLGELSTHAFQVVDCREVSLCGVPSRGKSTVGDSYILKENASKSCLKKKNRDLLKGSETTEIFSTFGLIT